MGKGAFGGAGKGTDPYGNKGSGRRVSGDWGASSSSHVAKHARGAKLTPAQARAAARNARAAAKNARDESDDLRN